MSDQYVGEIRTFAGTQAAPPPGWLFCEGQTLSSADPLYTLLSQIIGTTYGGGAGTFRIPDLTGRVPVGHDPAAPATGIGTNGGEETVTLTVAQMPEHTHPWPTYHAFEGGGAQGEEKHGIFATGNRPAYTGKFNPDAALDGQTVAPAGSSAPHNNMMPYTVVRFIIAYQGTDPRNIITRIPPTQ